MKSALIVTREQAEQKLREDIEEAKQRYANRIAKLAELESKLSEPPQYDAPNGLERYRQSLQMRRTGMTFKAIGNALNVTAGRASQMVAKAERMERDAAQSGGLHLSVRAQNVISNALSQSFLKTAPREIADKCTIKMLSDQANAGAKTLAEIQFWLHQQGLVLRRD